VERVDDGKTLTDSCLGKPRIIDQKLQDYKRISPTEGRCARQDDLSLGLCGGEVPRSYWVLTESGIYVNEIHHP
jgi:hypothetical protein